MQIKLNFLSVVVLSLFALFVFSACGAGDSFPSTSTQIESTKGKETTIFYKLNDYQLSQSERTRWVLPGKPEVEDKFLAELKTSLLASFDKYESIPEVTMLKNHYGQDISIGVLGKNMEDRRFLGGYSTAKITVLAYPPAARGSNKIRSLIGHYHSINGLSDFIAVPGFKTEDPVWSDARFLHELYHKYQFDIKQPSSTAPAGSTLWVEEELAAHSVARKVLDAGTKGEYLKRINKIVSRESAPSLIYMLNTWNPQDLIELDGLFKPATRFEYLNRVAQYYLDVCEIWLQKKYSGDNLHANMVNVYKNLH